MSTLQKVPRVLSLHKSRSGRFLNWILTAGNLEKSLPRTADTCSFVSSVFACVLLLLVAIAGAFLFGYHVLAPLITAVSSDPMSVSSLPSYAALVISFLAVVFAGAWAERPWATAPFLALIRGVVLIYDFINAVQRVPSMLKRRGNNEQKPPKSAATPAWRVFVSSLISKAQETCQSFVIIVSPEAAHQYKVQAALGLQDKIEKIMEDFSNPPPQLVEGATALQDQSSPARHGVTCLLWIRRATLHQLRARLEELGYGELIDSGDPSARRGLFPLRETPALQVVTPWGLPPRYPDGKEVIPAWSEVDALKDAVIPDVATVDFPRWNTVLVTDHPSIPEGKLVKEWFAYSYSRSTNAHSRLDQPATVWEHCDLPLDSLEDASHI